MFRLNTLLRERLQRQKGTLDVRSRTISLSEARDTLLVSIQYSFLNVQAIDIMFYDYLS
jgi:hypothetical protein